MPTAIKAMCTAKTARALGFLGDPQSANRECGRRGRVISQFRLHGNRGHYEDRGSLWPPWSHEMSGQKIMHRNSNSKYQLRCLNTLSQCIQVMVGKGTGKRHVGLCPVARSSRTGKNVVTQINVMVTILMLDLKQLITGGQSAASIAFNCVHFPIRQTPVSKTEAGKKLTTFLVSISFCVASQCRRTPWTPGIVSHRPSSSLYACP